MAQTRAIIQLRYNEAQIKLYEAHQWFREHRLPVRIILCKARRAGLSTGVESLIFDDTTTFPNTDSLIVANQKNPSENVLGMCTRFWKYMPKAVRFGHTVIPVRPPLAPQYNNNPAKDRLEFAAPLSSRIFIASSKSIDSYLSFGFQNMHATEAAYYDDGSELFRALSPTLSDDPHSAFYIESTPNGKTGRGEWFYEQVMRAELGRVTEYGDFKLVFIPWHEMVKSFSKPFADISERASFERSLKSDERDIMRQYPHINLEQMKWRRAKMAQPPFNKDADIFDQEYPSSLAEAFLMSGSSVFTRHAIKRLVSQQREPVWEGDIYWGDNDKANAFGSIYDLVRRPQFLTPGQADASGFASHVTDGRQNSLRVYRWPVRGERIIIGADVGRGNPNTENGDPSTMCVGVLNELARDELIMTWRGKLNPILFAEVCAALAWAIRYRVGDRVIKPALVPEWTGPGTATVTYLDEKNLYEVDRYRMPGVHGMPKSKHVGWESNAKTKPYAVNWMVRMIEGDMIEVPSKDVVLEMSNYRQLDNFGDEGSYGGAAGLHDDLVSAFQIMAAVMRLETSTIPGESANIEIDMDALAAEDMLEEPFDPFSQPTAEDAMIEETSEDEYGDDDLFYGYG